MCSPGLGFAALSIAGGMYSFAKQNEEYRKAQDLRAQNKQSAIDAAKIELSQLKIREKQERTSMLTGERLRTRKGLELVEQAAETKFYDTLNAEKVLGQIKAQNRGVRGLSIDVQRELGRARSTTDSNLVREKEMLSFESSIAKSNFKFLTQQLGIARQGVRANMMDRIRSFRMPSKPDPVSALLGISSGVMQGAGMDAKSDNSWSDWFKEGQKETKSSGRKGKR